MTTKKRGTRTRRQNRVDLALMLVLAVLLCLPFLVGQNDYILQVFTHAFLLAALALAWNIVGASGAVSLGHAAFFGIGAYGSALLSVDLELSPWCTIPLAGLLGACFGLIVGLLFVRLRGAYFALGTLACVEIPRVITDNWTSFTRGSLGLAGLPGLPSFGLGTWQSDIGAGLCSSYYLVLGYALMVLCLVAIVLHSSLGLALQAVREEETSAEAVGIPVEQLRLLSLLLSACLTGMSGAWYAHLIRYIEPGLVFGLHFSAIPMIFALCGGRFTILGPALAALVLYPLDQFVLHPLLPAGHEFLYGLVLVLCILFLPTGLWGTVRKAF